jgi:hypothetical protein
MADLSLTPTSVVKSTGAKTKNGIAGETIAAGQALYLASATGLLMKADDTSAAKAACVGIALNGGAINQPIQYQTAGLLTIGGTVAAGITYGVTDTAGGIGAISERASGDYVTLICTGSTTSVVDIDIKATGVAIA